MKPVRSRTELVYLPYGESMDGGLEKSGKHQGVVAQDMVENVESKGTFNFHARRSPHSMQQVFFRRTTTVPYAA